MREIKDITAVYFDEDEKVMKIIIKKKTRVLTRIELSNFLQQAAKCLYSFISEQAFKEIEKALEKGDTTVNFNDFVIFENFGDTKRVATLGLCVSPKEPTP